MMQMTPGRGGLMGIVCLALMFVQVAMPGQDATAQSAPSPQPREEWVAISDQGFGVARLEIPVGQVDSQASVRVVVREGSGRILYPAVEVISEEPPPSAVPNIPRESSGRPRPRAILQRIRGAIDRLRDQIDPPESLRIHFLFTGTETLRVEISGDLQRTLEIQPQVIPEPLQSRAAARDPTVDRMLVDWWAGYVAQTKIQLERSDYPTLIERYLVQMLSHRTGAAAPDILKPRPKLAPKQSDPIPTLSLVAGVESLRGEVAQALWQEPMQQGGPRLTVPTPPNWQDQPLPELPPDIEIETIAHAVPEDCFYIRFGSFANYLWFQKIGEARGGEITQLALLRGFNYESTGRIERLLNTKMNVVSKLFGDSVIQDMAIVGHDLYLAEGPTMGVLFEAKNLSLLRTSFEQERNSTVQRMQSEGCQLQSLTIDGEPVSLLSMPDNSIRSFMVVSDPYVFLTTSEVLARRFLAVRRSGGSLGDSPEFRYARWMMPVGNRYDVFAYFSAPFFRNLISPHYQIELRRRLQAIASIETAELASLVDAMELQRGFAFPDRYAVNGQPQASPIQTPQSASQEIDRWISKGLLPAWFQRRSDGSETLRFLNAWQDSVRGRRGSFLPIADTPVVDCTPEEASMYESAADFYSQEWQETDPLMFGLRRFAHPERPKVERLALEAYVAPLGSDKFGRLGVLLAPPVPSQVDMPPDDLVNAQVRLSGVQTSRFYSEDHFMFAGLKDMTLPLPEETRGLFATLRILRSLPAYLGSWPKAGYLDLLPLGLAGGPPDTLGFSRMLLGIWRWQMGGFSVLSFDRRILESCAMHLKVSPAEDYAQGRLRIRDLSSSRLASWFHSLSFRQAAQTTRGNLLLLDSLSEQLGVVGPDAKGVAERLLDAKLQCTLGGEYTWNGNQWETSAWPASVALAPGVTRSSIGFDAMHTVAPENYSAPWLEWFRGMQLHLTQLPERLVVVGELDMEPLPPMPKNGGEASDSGSLPAMNIDLYNLPFKFFQKDKPSGSSTDADAKSKPGEPAAKRKF